MKNSINVDYVAKSNFAIPFCRVVPRLEYNIPFSNVLHTSLRPKSLLKRIPSIGRSSSSSDMKRVVSDAALKSLEEGAGGDYCALLSRLVQIDWTSTEDGNHILTVAVGSYVYFYSQVVLLAATTHNSWSLRPGRAAHEKELRLSCHCQVSEDVAQVNVTMMKESELHKRPLLRKASSFAVQRHRRLVRWVRLRTLELRSSAGVDLAFSSTV